MLQAVFNALLGLGILAIPLLAALFIFLRHVFREKSYERAFQGAKSELDKLAMTLSYAQLVVDGSPAGRKYIRDFRKLRAEFRALSKRSELFIEQGANSAEWHELALEAKKKSVRLVELADLVRDEIYWARLATRMHRSTQRALSCWNPLPEDRERFEQARDQIVDAGRLLERGQYLQSWEISRQLQPMLEVHSRPAVSEDV